MADNSTKDADNIKHSISSPSVPSAKPAQDFVDHYPAELSYVPASPEEAAYIEQLAEKLRVMRMRLNMHRQDLAAAIGIDYDSLIGAENAACSPQFIENIYQKVQQYVLVKSQ